MNDLGTNDVRPVSVLVLGQLQSPEFAPVADELSCRQHVKVTIRESLSDLSTNTGPADLVVVLQRWPEEYSRRTVFTLLNEAPLSRLMVCCGPWCDSDARTRNRWPLAVCVRAEFAAARLRHELAVIAGTNSPLPMTGNRDEAYVFDHDTPLDVGAAIPTDLPLNVDIVTPDPAIRDWLQIALESAVRVFHTSSSADADLILWDADPWTPKNAEALTARRQSLPTTPIIALSGYSRPDVEQQIRRVGATTVVAKLAPLTQLVRVVADVIGQIDTRRIHLATHQ